MNKLVVTLDAGRFKAYRLEERAEYSRPRLLPIEDWQTEVNDRISEQLTDKAGQFSKGGLSFASINDMADGERHTLHTERRRRALKRMALRIGELLQREPVDGFYLAAPAEITGQLHANLDPAVRGKIERQIPANLTRLSPTEVLDHVCES